LRRALAQLALSPHSKRMDKPHTQFEPIQLEAYSAWRVRVSLPHGVQHYVSSFKTEAEARTWIDENSAVWLMRYAGGIICLRPPHELPQGTYEPALTFSLRAIIARLFAPYSRPDALSQGA
jgi:hypothetical protein